MEVLESCCGRLDAIWVFVELDMHAVLAVIVLLIVAVGRVQRKWLVGIACYAD